MDNLQSYSIMRNGSSYFVLDQTRKYYVFSAEFYFIKILGEHLCSMTIVAEDFPTRRVIKLIFRMVISEKTYYYILYC